MAHHFMSHGLCFTGPLPPTHQALSQPPQTRVSLEKYATVPWDRSSFFMEAAHLVARCVSSLRSVHRYHEAAAHAVRKQHVRLPSVSCLKEVGSRLKGPLVIVQSKQICLPGVCMFSERNRRKFHGTVAHFQRKQHMWLPGVCFPEGVGISFMKPLPFPPGNNTFGCQV